MQAVNIRTFTRGFPKLRYEPVTVTDRYGRAVGTWTPSPKQPKPVNFEKRVREYCAGKLPFTGADLVRDGRKR
jgi:hypothetical protein